MIQFVPFHQSGPIMQKPSHTLYRDVDWSRVDAGLYAVVDPMDTHAILYLTEKEYKLQVRVSLSQDSSLVVLARPGDKPVLSTQTSSSEPDSQNSPLTVNQLIGPAGKKQEWKKFLSWHISALRKMTEAKGSQKRSGRDDSSASVALSAAVLRTLIPYWGLDLHFRLGRDIVPPRELVRALRQFADTLADCLAKNGPQFLILRMKNALFMLQKYIARTPATDPWLLGQPVSLSKSGIPRILPPLLRRWVGRDSENCTGQRLCISLLNAFRAFEGSHDPQGLTSILGPHPELDSNIVSEFETFCKEVFWKKVIPEYVPAKTWKELSRADFCIKEYDPVYIPAHAGPNSSFGLFGAPADALAWTQHPINWVLRWCDHVGDTRTPGLFSHSLKAYSWSHHENLATRQCGKTGLHEVVYPKIGKLQCLPEPAGKVRTIAIVDYWTQRVMSPVHNWMMDILSYIPMDGTFDQEGALSSFNRYVANHEDERLYSIDLKSATDLIPLQLYRILFGAIWGSEKADLWINLLTDRWFYVPGQEKLVTPSLRGCSIRYGRGQPMGTLSSWPSMALVHHAITLFAAMKAGRDPVDFTGYRVLGDDNVTAGTDVAQSYVAVAAALKVPTSPAKTLDGDAYIFAQQMFNKRGVNLSPLSLKEELGITSMSKRLEQALRAVRRGWLQDKVTVPRFLRLLLTRRDYSLSLRRWSEGKLGRIAQSALVSAFGLLRSRVLNALQFRGSGVELFLGAIAQKMAVHGAGDQSQTGMESRSATMDRAERAAERELRENSCSTLAEFERALACRIASDMKKEFDRALEEIRVHSIRFRMWHESVVDCGMLPIATFHRQGIGANKRPAPTEPGILATLANYRASHLREMFDTGKLPGCPDLTRGKFPMEYPTFLTGTDALRSMDLFGGDTKGTKLRVPRHEGLRGFHLALWPIIHDSYKSLFGEIVGASPAENAEAALDYSDVVAEEEEYGGMGMTFSPDPDMIPTPGGSLVRRPGVVEVVEKARNEVARLVSELVSDTPNPAPWLTLEQLAAVLADIQRLPDFTGLKSFKRSVVATSDFSQMLRQVHIMHDVLGFYPRDVDFTTPTIADLPWATSFHRPADEDMRSLWREIADVEAQPNSVVLAEVTAKTNEGLLTG